MRTNLPARARRRRSGAALRVAAAGTALTLTGLLAAPGATAEPVATIAAVLPHASPVVTATAAATTATTTATATGAGRDTVDEIHAAFGNNAGKSVWIYWHGSASRVHYGRTSSYGHTAKAHVSPVSQVDISGHIERAHLKHLRPGAGYHYRIDNGADHQVRTAPTGKIHWDDIGDTGTTLNTFNPATGSGCDKPWMADVWRGVAADRPNFVTHGGDISYANECGVGSVHQFYNDIAPVATNVAWEQTWGNHEYGPPSSNPPPGTPRDSMANYKSRNFIPNRQSAPNDTRGQVRNPGCPSAADPSVNGCRGSDWGSFVAGHVLFITEPEPWVDAQIDWGPRAGALMKAAEKDHNISFIVTMGHRPAYTSVDVQSDPALRKVIDGLAEKYSPSARRDGKYVLNLGHHVHGGEVFKKRHGVVHITNGGGGVELIPSSAKAAPGSIFRLAHFEHLRFKATRAHLTIKMICGPPFPDDSKPEACTEGSTVYSRILTVAPGV